METVQRFDGATRTWKAIDVTGIYDCRVCGATGCWEHPKEQLCQMHWAQQFPDRARALCEAKESHTDFAGHPFPLNPTWTTVCVFCDAVFDGEQAATATAAMLAADATMILAHAEGRS